MNCHMTDPITEAIAYIESHLDQNLNLERVADAVHYSRYHLHRMFTAAAGMTLHDYIRRRKLTKAAGLFPAARDPDRAGRRLWKPAGFYGYFQSPVQAKPCRLPEAAAILSPAVCVSAVQAAFLPRRSSLSGRLCFLPRHPGLDGTGRLDGGRFPLL